MAGDPVTRDIVREITLARLQARAPRLDMLRARLADTHKSGIVTPL